MSTYPPRECGLATFAEDLVNEITKAALIRPRVNWSKKDLQDMLYQHLSLTKGELLARLNADYPGDIKGFDNIYMQALMMADSLSDGIVKQSPAKFGKK